MAYEIPMYRFRKGVSFEEAKGVVLSLNEFLRTAPGFKVRKTYYDDRSEVWIDVVEWKTMEHALSALDAFAKSPLCEKFASLADPSFNHMHHGRLVQTFTG